jgi:hypothetical protein
MRGGQRFPTTSWGQVLNTDGNPSRRLVGGEKAKQFGFGVVEPNFNLGSIGNLGVGGKMPVWKPSEALRCNPQSERAALPIAAWVRQFYTIHSSSGG